MGSRGPGHGLHFRTDWVVILVVQLCLVGCSADYFWDGTEWVWKDSPGDLAAAEGSGDGGHTGLYNHDDEDDEGSGEQEEDDYHDHLVHEMDTEVLDSDIVNVDDEIDPRDLDIGFHEDITSGPDRPEAAPQTPPSIVPSDPLVPGDDPTKYYNQDTNFFAQPRILTGGTVVGLLCTILLVMFIVYRMRKADEGSYSLNEPKRSPNVHSYLKAPSREFFA